MLGGPYAQIVALRMWALGPHRGEVVRHAHLVAPIEAQALSRLLWRHDRRQSRVARARARHLERHARPNGQRVIDAHLLAKARVGTRGRPAGGSAPSSAVRAVATVAVAVAAAAAARRRRGGGVRSGVARAGRPWRHDHRLAIDARLVNPQVVRRVERREQTDGAQIGVDGEDVLAQVLRALEVLQQACHEDGAAVPWRLGARAAGEFGGGGASPSVLKTTISSTLNMAHARATCPTS